MDTYSIHSDTNSETHYSEFDWEDYSGIRPNSLDQDTQSDLVEDIHLERPPITPHTCKHCQRVVLRTENFTEPPRHLVLPLTVAEVRQAIEEQCDFFKLFLSADYFYGSYHAVFCSGCHRCRFHMNRLLELKVQLKRMLGLGKSKKISYHCTKQAYNLRLESLWTRTLVLLRLRPEKEWDGIPGLRYCGWLKPMEIVVTVPPLVGVQGKSASRLSKRLEFGYNGDVASESTLGQMHHWLTECHSSHALCRQEKSSFVPRRLLRIDPGTSPAVVRLVENLQGAQVCWAALSYVWGGDQKLKTTITSIADMKAGIAVEKLPQTLQDAVTVCRALHLDLLWVDALCIVQDDMEDLNRELLSMPQIYQRAWVTISASTAASVMDGFLQERCYSHDSTPMSLPYLADDGVATDRVIFVDAPGSRCIVQENPILERAWTYQERRISPRTLDFSHDGVILYCHTHKRCQSYGSFMDWSRDVDGDRDPDVFHLLEERRIFKPVSEYRELPPWHDIVSGYATRKLSFSSDKLPALSALASLYKQRTGYTYLAGLWKESLVSDLCWSTNGNRLRPRPDEYRAPSWSWAAVDLAPWYSSKTSGSTRIYDEESDTVAHPIAKVINVALRQDPPDSTYGKILDGFLTLEAPVLWTKLRCDAGEVRINLGGDYVIAYADTKEDASRRGTTSRSAVLAVLMTHLVFAEETGANVYYGLILVPASEGRYRRVGRFHVAYDYEEEFDEGVSSLFNIRTITII